jgi:diguanylate cyclase (GGDEF)-like protein
MTASAHDQLGQAEVELQVFHEIARALTSSLDLSSVLSAITTQIERLFCPETWALLLSDEQKSDLHCILSGGRFGSQFANIRVTGRGGLAGWVSERGEALILSNAQDGSLPLAEGEFRGNFEVHSAVCIPLRSRLQTLGVIELFNLPSNSLSDHAISFLHVLCDFAAIAIENARTLERVQNLTIHDECTGLFNLRHFDESLRNEITRSERQDLPLSLIFLDLDHFKQVNDQHGHQVGSELLAQVAETIRSNVRGIDLAFRYGGDEFIVLLPGTDNASALQVANRLLDALRATAYGVPEDGNISITASFGVATYPADGKTGAQILRAADAKMYEVKATTRNAIGFTRED